MRAGIMMAMVAGLALAGGTVGAQQAPPQEQQAQEQQAQEQQAQEQQAQEQQAQEQQQQALPNMPSDADRVVGKQVIGQKGEQVGEVSDVLISKDGKVAGVVMDHGGALGVGGSSVLIPWDQMSIQGDQLSLKMTDEQVQQLPSID